MKNYNITMMKKIIQSVVLIMGLIGYAQEDILFSFANSEITTEGVDSFYEVDVMIQTVNTATGSFKLGSGQLYFNYNIAAFGSNVHANMSFSVERQDGYISNQDIDAIADFKIYKSFITNDNTASRVSWAFDQNYSSSTFADDNITTTAKALCRLVFKFIDVNADPMLTFENGVGFDNQFYTACGSAGGGTGDSADCTGFPGIQIMNDSFDNSGAVLSIDLLNNIVEFSVFPNPTQGLVYVEINKDRDYLVFDMLGKQIKHGSFSQGKNELQLKKYEAGIYFLKVFDDSNLYTKRIILE